MTGYNSEEAKKGYLQEYEKTIRLNHQLELLCQRYRNQEYDLAELLGRLGLAIRVHYNWLNLNCFQFFIILLVAIL